MLRTVELGRAVITTETSLELWLTTLITLSSKQNCIDLEQLSNSALISFLTSGGACVYRSECMSLVSDITMRGEPVDRDDMESLAARIVNAPAWGQLNLLPSIPEQLGQFGNQTIRINLGQSSKDIDDGIKKCHRLVATMVPDGVPTLALHSIHLNIIVSENMSKTSVQRLRKSQMESTPSFSQDTFPYDDGKGDTPSALSDEQLNLEHCSDEEILFATTEPSLARQTGKRKRSVTASNVHMHVPDSTGFPSDTKRYCHGISSTLGTPLLDSHTLQKSEVQLLSHMVDAAVRFSVLNSLKGSATGLKVKANNFTARLADVAPTLWRPGFLSVRVVTKGLSYTNVEFIP
ncbi:hypothetical protein DM02DRAFT_676054 [Periconia macrospinosa]|uniref:Uncharacterized protein n=1 Tax=Periconia macrospinosa TaxID=97972 RepID=A0A2V1DAS7_9PLEO|nr:hypothetical protein DM02DRAFT_676054 [Periconia macrospinosa]